MYEMGTLRKNYSSKHEPKNKNKFYVRTNYLGNLSMELRGRDRVTPDLKRETKLLEKRHEVTKVKSQYGLR